MQRRLFPHLSQPRTQSSGQGSDQQLDQQSSGIDPDQDDTLETVESERISNFQYFEDENRGKFEIEFILGLVEYVIFGKVVNEFLRHRRYY